MSFKRTVPAGLIPLGYQKMTLENSTAGSLNSTCNTATAIRFSVQTQDVRYRDDGSAAALSTGVLYKKDLEPYLIEGINGANVSFQRSTGSCVVNLMAYRRPGE